MKKYTAIITLKQEFVFDIEAENEAETKDKAYKELEDVNSPSKSYDDIEVKEVKDEKSSI